MKTLLSIIFALLLNGVVSGQHGLISAQNLTQDVLESLECQDVPVNLRKLPGVLQDDSEADGLFPWRPRPSDPCEPVPGEDAPPPFPPMDPTPAQPGPDIPSPQELENEAKPIIAWLRWRFPVFMSMIWFVVRFGAIVFVLVAVAFIFNFASTIGGKDWLATALIEPFRQFKLLFEKIRGMFARRNTR